MLRELDNREGSKLKSMLLAETSGRGNGRLVMVTLLFFLVFSFVFLFTMELRKEELKFEVGFVG